jgi:hypothetical protein
MHSHLNVCLPAFKICILMMYFGDKEPNFETDFWSAFWENPSAR